MAKTYHGQPGLGLLSRMCGGRFDFYRHLIIQNIIDSSNLTQIYPNTLENNNRKAVLSDKHMEPSNLLKSFNFTLDRELALYGSPLIYSQLVGRVFN